jgi:hypothetical protein
MQEFGAKVGLGYQENCSRFICSYRGPEMIYVVKVTLARVIKYCLGRSLDHSTNRAGVAVR